jgi:hypothetical protein
MKPFFAAASSGFVEVTLINKGSRAGLNTGFVNWMIGGHGQLLTQKSGLIPATAVVRIIQMSEE